MGVRIDCKSREILHCKNSTFCALYENIINYIENADVDVRPIEKLINTLQLGCDGVGSDIADYLKERNDAYLFADLVKIGIYQLEAIPTLSQETKELLWNFHKAILEYAETLNQ